MAEVKSLVIRYAGGDWRTGIFAPEGWESCSKCGKDVGDDGWNRATGVSNERSYEAYCDACAKDVLAGGETLTSATEVWDFNEDDMDPIRVIPRES